MNPTCDLTGNRAGPDRVPSLIQQGSVAGKSRLEGGWGEPLFLLLERYTAFTARGKLRGLFRVWHDPWPQRKLKDVKIESLSLLKDARGGGEWVDHLRLIGGNASTGATDVWMGRPHLI